MSYNNSRNSLYNSQSSGHSRPIISDTTDIYRNTSHRELNRYLTGTQVSENYLSKEKIEKLEYEIKRIHDELRNIKEKQLESRDTNKLVEFINELKTKVENLKNELTKVDEKHRKKEEECVNEINVNMENISILSQKLTNQPKTCQPNDDFQKIQDITAKLQNDFKEHKEHMKQKNRELSKEMDTIKNMLLLKDRQSAPSDSSVMKLKEEINNLKHQLKQKDEELSKKQISLDTIKKKYSEIKDLHVVGNEDEINNYKGPLEQEKKIRIQAQNEVKKLIEENKNLLKELESYRQFPNCNMPMQHQQVQTNSPRSSTNDSCENLQQGTSVEPSTQTVANNSPLEQNNKLTADHRGRQFPSRKVDSFDYKGNWNNPSSNN